MALGKRRYRSYTAAEKDGFFALLDRLGNISAAAKELGINVQTAVGWAYRARAVMREPSKEKGAVRRDSQGLKDEFFTVLDRVGSVSVAARELGLNREMCFNWARAVGIASIHPNAGKRAEFDRLRKSGLSRKEAAAAVGIHRNTAYLFDNGLVQSKGRTTTYQGGSDMAYKQEVTTPLAAPPTLEATFPSRIQAAGVEQPPAPVTAVAPVVQQSLEQVISGRYLALPERELIADLLRSGSSARAIAQALGRSPSSIIREINRNSHPVLGYQPYAANRAATGRRARPKDSKLAAPGELRDYVKTKLLTRWSPEQISNLLIKEFPDDPHLRVSHETIYQSLYLQARGGL
ncbi:helix-turn-helix domain-containing protein, partial [Arthrobacter sp. H14]|uniref:helix-turn-helix domain-containing protein n=1 Tax=Arthrobacter sp. H14 TaxID=1312959 RepID=UPI0012DDC493